jgi:hypothetical protein
MRLAELAVDANQLAGAQREAAPFDAGKDLSGEPPLDGVRLDQDQRALDRHRAATRLGDGVWVDGPRTSESRRP